MLFIVFIVAGIEAVMYISFIIYFIWRQNKQGFYQIPRWRCSRCNAVTTPKAILFKNDAPYIQYYCRRCRKTESVPLIGIIGIIGDRYEEKSPPGKIRSNVRGR